MLSQNMILRTSNNELRESQTDRKKDFDEKLKNQQDIIDKLQLKQDDDLQEIMNLNAKLKIEYDAHNEYEKKYQKLFDLQQKIKSNNNQLLSNQHLKLIDDHKELELKYSELQNKYKQQKLLSSSYKTWDSYDVINWIVNIDKNKLNKYKIELTKNILKEGIDGSCLSVLTTNDLHRCGVTNFKHKQLILNNIKNLINQ